MKNLPEDELFNALENRLRNYQEDPDEMVWKGIRSTLPFREPDWIVWANRIAAGLLVASLVFLFYPKQGDTESLTRTKSVAAPDAFKSEGQSERIRSDAERQTAQTRDADKIEQDRAFIYHRTPPEVLKKYLLLKKKETSIQSTLEVTSESLSFPIDDQVRIKENGEVVPDSLLLVRRELPQENNQQIEISRKKQRRKSGITLYSMITPLLSFHKVSPDANDNIVIESMNNPPVLSTRRLGISLEVGMSGKISPRWQYTAGLSYYHQSQVVAYQQQSNAIVTSQENMSYEILPGIKEHSFDYTMHNVGVQAGLLHTLSQRGLIHQVGVIIQYQHGLSHVAKNEVYNNAMSNYLNYQLLYRVEYKVNSKVNFFVQPTFTHSLISNESLQAPFRIKQTRAGIGMGIVYSF